MLVLVNDVLLGAVFGVLVFGVLVRMRMDRTVGVAVFVFMGDVLVRMSMGDSAGVLVFVGMPFAGVRWCCHVFLYSL